MRFIVEQKQTFFSRKAIRCSGSCSASRRTRLSSVPTTHDVPAGAAAIVWMIFSVEPDLVGQLDDLVLALRVHDAP